MAAGEHVMADGEPVMADGPGTSPDQPSRLVRPYALIGGRTRTAHDDLELETLVFTTSLGETSSLGDPAPRLNQELRSIALLCRDLLSVAEIGAHLDLPLGVVRVLVGDMAAEGLVTVYRPAPDGDRPDLALLERVLYGLRRTL
jgi:hypothetical protein